VFSFETVMCKYQDFARIRYSDDLELSAWKYFWQEVLPFLYGVWSFGSLLDLYEAFQYYVYIVIDALHILYGCFNSIATLGVHSVFDRTATAYDFVCAMADRIYWLDDTYVQPFYAWAAPRLRDVAISGLFWGLIRSLMLRFGWTTRLVRAKILIVSSLLRLKKALCLEGTFPSVGILWPSTIIQLLIFCIQHTVNRRTRSCKNWQLFNYKQRDF
jgi:hypothetical protein